MRPDGIRPYPIRIGERLVCPDLGDAPLTVCEVLEDGPNGGRRCLVEANGHREELPESLLEPLPPSAADPVSFLEGLAWDPPHHYFSRVRLTLDRTAWYEDTAGIPTLLGARVYPMAHQLYAARRILEDRTLRFVLADEVGLGKTVEVGLVVQALLADAPELRVLVLAPGSMSRQWQCELYLRFGGHVFCHVAGDTPSGEAIAEVGKRRVVVSTTALMADPAVRAAVVARPWDLVVVDEAHQVPPSHSLYGTLRALCTAADGALVLSATPSKREAVGLVGLLALVAPEAWSPDDIDVLSKRLDERRDVWALLHTTIDMLAAARQASSDGRLDREELEFVVEDWQASLGGEPEIDALLARAGAGEMGALDELVAYAQEYCRVDHRILRTRRCTLSALGVRFPERRVEWLDYTPSAPEALLAEHAERLAAPAADDHPRITLRAHLIQMLSTTPDRVVDALRARLDALGRGPTGVGARAVALALASDPGPDEEASLRRQLVAAVAPLPDERQWLDEALGYALEWQRAEGERCARLRAVMRDLDGRLGADDGAKVLIFARDHTVVQAMVAMLRTERPQWKADGFHRGLAPGALEEVAQRFQQPGGSTRVLVSDELGGEGRNFQVADALVHIDTPPSVARIEQRIGRLDRMGRRDLRPVTSVVVRGPLAAERAVQDILHRAFAVYTRSVGGLEFALPRLQSTLLTALGTGRDLAAVGDTLAREVRTTLADVDEDFEVSLDTTRQRLDEASELAEVLAESTADRAQDDARVVRHWLGSLDVDDRRDRSRETVSFSWSPDPHGDAVHGLAAGGGATSYGTFDRERALVDESLPYFGPGHVLVNAALRALSTANRGRATVLARSLGRAHRGAWFVAVLGVGRPDPAVWGGRDVPAGLRVRGYRHLSPSADLSFVRIHLDDDAPPTLVTDAELIEMLSALYRRKEQGDVALVPTDLASTFDLATLWPAVRAAVELAVEAQQGFLDDLRDEALAEFDEALRIEVGYLQGQRRRGSPAERAAADVALEDRALLRESICQAAVEVEAVGLIFGKG